MDKRRRILVASSDEINREFFEIMFDKLGFDVVLASNGEEALDIIQESRPDIMILDSEMPEMSGWEVTKTIKKDSEYSEFSDIPIIMLSEMDNPEDIIEGFDIGVEDYIRKPFSFAVVYARLKSALRNRDLMSRRLHKDEVMSVIKSLNNTMSFLREHLEKPLDELNNAVVDFEKGKNKTLDEFSLLIKDKTSRMTAAVESISDEIAELEKTKDEMQSLYFDISVLEENYKSHLAEATK
jgi:DNA-binding response OmpR family regulator